MMEKSKAVALLNKQIEAGGSALAGRADAKKWKLDVAALLEHIFGPQSARLKSFHQIRWTPSMGYLDRDNSGVFRAAEQNATQNALALLQSALTEVQEIWDEEKKIAPANPFQRIERICNQFHRVSLQLRHRHGSRKAIDIGDEYDVQYIIHALLMLDFEDIRAEEWTPSYAGGCSRIDFVLKKEQIALEVKMTRKSLTGREVGAELIVDCERYKSHPNCNMLVCFVYDPGSLIANPRGFENDLATAGGDLPVRVFIRP